MSEVIKYITEDEGFYLEDSTTHSIFINLDKKNLKLLKELHGAVVINEFFLELANTIKHKLELEL